MAKSLIIVESPAKTKTLRSFLGKDFAIEASMGHVRDLPENKMGVDVADNFKPNYEPIAERKDVLAKLAAAAKGAEKIYLASDPDREGEAIAWHIANALKLPENRVHRIQFNEITRSVVQEAIKNPRQIDMDKVNAQQARRVLDRLVGYTISPLLRKKISQRMKLSAGRVQSVVLRLICERERAIRAFVPTEYWTLTARLTPQEGKKPHPFDAHLNAYRGKKIELKNQADTDRVLADLNDARYRVDKVKRSERQRKAAPPFITSTLQQEAARKLGFSSKRAMTVAQQLYEGIDLGNDGGQVGLITYMRTDSTRVSSEAQADAKQYIQRTYGPEYAPERYNVYKTKGDAQDAHEAIRPTSVFREPDAIRGHLNNDQYKLYRLIWLRFVASQMKAAVLDVVTADILANDYTFRATGSTVKFDGFLRVYTEGKDDATQVDDEEKPPLPPLTDGQPLTLLELLPKQHFTEPPPRFTEATLVKEMEAQGIGRPSTYASFISTLQDREYVELKEKKFYPTELGFVVTDMLVGSFPEIMDVNFTAAMETKLDGVADGKQDWVALMKDFYGPFEATVKQADQTMGKFAREIDEACPECGSPLVERFGRFGKFIACSNHPNCKYIKKEEKKGDAEAAPPVVSEITCPNCGRNLVEKTGRFGKFLACPGYPECKYIHKAAAKTTGIKCPSCTEGEITEKRSPKGIFYGCSNYPKCRFTLSSKPINRPCPLCGSLLMEKVSKGDVVGIKCSNKACGYAADVLPADLNSDPSRMAA
ncbi:MAG: type I DNA topoisomerase [Capsulimonadales bacterium]|nr:type I DNA topoisomerase [Capsulimonadales bacterium]